MADLNDDIKKYLNGELTPSEMHALEKKALDDPFLEDALEGATQLGSNAFDSDLSAIGPMWGHGALQRFGEGSAYATAAAAFFATTFLVLSYQPPSEPQNDLP